MTHQLVNSGLKILEDTLLEWSSHATCFSDYFV